MDGERVTQLLQEIRGGAAEASRRLIDVVHTELHRMAEVRMRSERAGHTLQATALVNEAYMRLQVHEADLEDRAHFFGAASRAMERVLVDHARRRLAQKRGGDAARMTLNELDVATPDGAPFDALEIHEAVEALERESPELASLVRYRYFVGLTLEQVAEIDGASVATLKRRWTFARAWLHARLDT